jgi:hypothetical protein
VTNGVRLLQHCYDTCNPEISERDWHQRIDQSGQKKASRLCAESLQGISLGCRSRPQAKGDRFARVVFVSLGRKCDWSSTDTVFHPKSEDSIGDLPVDAEVIDLFRKYYKAVKGAFVIKCKRSPLPAKPQQYYRLAPILWWLSP